MSKDNENLNKAKNPILNITDVMYSAYKSGYEQRVIDQLQAALDGQPIGSHYNEEKLNKLADKYVSKQIVQEYEKQLSDVISSVCEHERVDVPDDIYGDVYYCKKCDKWIF